MANVFRPKSQGLRHAENEHPLITVMIGPGSAEIWRRKTAPWKTCSASAVPGADSRPEPRDRSGDVRAEAGSIPGCQIV